MDYVGKAFNSPNAGERRGDGREGQALAGGGGGWLGCHMAARSARGHRHYTHAPTRPPPTPSTRLPACPPPPPPRVCPTSHCPQGLLTQSLVSRLPSPQTCAARRCAWRCRRTSWWVRPCGACCRATSTPKSGSSWRRWWGWTPPQVRGGVPCAPRRRIQRQSANTSAPAGRRWGGRAAGWLCVAGRCVMRGGGPLSSKLRLLLDIAHAAACGMAHGCLQAVAAPPRPQRRPPAARPLPRHDPPARTPEGGRQVGPAPVWSAHTVCVWGRGGGARSCPVSQVPAPLPPSSTGSVLCPSRPAWLACLSACYGLCPSPRSLLSCPPTSPAAALACAPAPAPAGGGGGGGPTPSSSAAPPKRGGAGGGGGGGGGDAPPAHHHPAYALAHHSPSRSPSPGPGQHPARTAAASIRPCPLPSLLSPYCHSPGAQCAPQRCRPPPSGRAHMPTRRR